MRNQFAHFRPLLHSIINELAAAWVDQQEEKRDGRTPRLDGGKELGHFQGREGSKKITWNAYDSLTPRSHQPIQFKAEIGRTSRLLRCKISQFPSSSSTTNPLFPGRQRLWRMERRKGTKNASENDQFLFSSTLPPIAAPPFLPLLACERADYL